MSQVLFEKPEIKGVNGFKVLQFPMGVLAQRYTPALTISYSAIGGEQPEFAV